MHLLLFLDGQKKSRWRPHNANDRVGRDRGPTEMEPRTFPESPAKRTPLFSFLRELADRMPVSIYTLKRLSAPRRDNSSFLREVPPESPIHHIICISNTSHFGFIFWPCFTFFCVRRMYYPLANSLPLRDGKRETDFQQNGRKMAGYYSGFP